MWDVTDRGDNFHDTRFLGGDIYMVDPCMTPPLSFDNSSVSRNNRYGRGDFRVVVFDSCGSRGRWREIIGIVLQEL